MSNKAVDAFGWEPFSFHNWYPRFRVLSIRSVIIPLSASAAIFIESGAFVLPPHKNPKPTKSNSHRKQPVFDDDDYDSNNNVCEDGVLCCPVAVGAASVFSDNEDEDEDNPQHLTAQEDHSELVAALADAIRYLGGCVFPKTNFSAPRDAAWMALNKSLACRTPDDILLLLKASDVVSFDFSIPVSKRVIVLRQWTDLQPSHEFRCWVFKQKLVAISQRDHRTFYPFLRDTRARFGESAKAFIESKLCPLFPCDSYCVDIYFLDSNGQRPFVIDFNPFTERCDTLLFSWEELARLQQSPPTTVPEIRTVELQLDADQAAPAFRTNGVPLDLLRMSQGKTAMDFAQDWQNALQDPTQYQQFGDNNDNETTD